MDDVNMIQNAVGGAPAADSLPPSPPAGLGTAEPAHNPMQEIASLDRRMRQLEERLSNLRKRTLAEEQNTIRNTKKTQGELRVLQEEMREMRISINDMQSKFKILINELKLYATKEEIHVVEKYVNMWEPVTFVTRKEAENMVRRIVEDEYHLEHNKKEETHNPHIR